MKLVQFIKLSLLGEEEFRGVFSVRASLGVDESLEKDVGDI